jgi:RNA polymerase sigma-70 factor (ECF subfamily)
MGEISSPGNDDQDDLLRRAAEGEGEARMTLIGQHRDRLLRAITLRLDRRVRRRLDPSDVLQDATIDALRRFDEYFKNPPMPLFPWLRFLAVQQVTAAHRQHLGAKQRDARREVRAGPDPGPLPSSADLAAQLVAGHTTPSQAAVRRETQARIREVLDEMDPLDREVRVLRHFEELKNVEAAQCLGIEPSAATKRYQRAMKRLRELFKSLAGWNEA